MCGGVRVGRTVGGSLALGALAAGSSRGVQGRKWPTSARASASGTFLDSRRLGRQQKALVCGSSGVWDCTSVRDGKPLVLPGQPGQRRYGRKRGGSGEGVGVGWQRRWQPLESWRRGRQRLLVSERESTARTAADEGVSVRDSDREGVGAGDGRCVGVRESVSE